MNWISQAHSVQPDPYDGNDERVLKLELFLRGDSELCKEALAAAEALCEQREGIELSVHDVLQDSSALKRYWEFMDRYHVQKPVLPVFYACHRLKVGFRAKEGSDAIATLFDVHAYVRPSCQHCRDARAFLTLLAERWNGIRVVYHDVTSDSHARAEMQNIARRHGVTATSLPGIVICGRYFSGYRSDATTGREIEKLLEEGAIAKPDKKNDDNPKDNPASSARSLSRQSAHAIAIESFIEVPIVLVVAIARDLPIPEIESENASDYQLPPESSDDLATQGIYEPPEQTPAGIDLPWIGFVSVSDWGLPLFTLLIGLIDGFNPCAMWVLVFLLSVLVNVKDRRKIAAIAGTFVLVSGVVYFAFMSAWLNLFMLIGIARPLQVAIGLLALFIGIVNVKDFFAFKRGITLSIPESSKPGIYDRVRKIVTAKYLSVAVGLSVVLALVVNVVELLCTAGLPALYTQILTMQQLPAWKNYAYLGLYNLGYIFDDALMVIAFVATLSHQKLREAEGRWLKLVSGCIVLALGLTVLLKPEWLQWGGG